MLTNGLFFLLLWLLLLASEQNLPFSDYIMDTKQSGSALIRPGRIDRKIEFPLPGIHTKTSQVRIQYKSDKLLGFFLQGMELSSGTSSPSSTDWLLPWFPTAAWCCQGWGSCTCPASGGRLASTTSRTSGRGSRRWQLTDLWIIYTHGKNSLTNWDVLPGVVVKTHLQSAE